MFCVAAVVAAEENPREEKALHAEKSERLDLVDRLSSNCNAAMVVESDDWVVYCSDMNGSEERIIFIFITIII